MSASSPCCVNQNFKRPLPHVIRQPSSYYTHTCVLILWETLQRPYNVTSVSGQRQGSDTICNFTGQGWSCCRVGGHCIKFERYIRSSSTDVYMCFLSPLSITNNRYRFATVCHKLIINCCSQAGLVLQYVKKPKLGNSVKASLNGVFTGNGWLSHPCSCFDPSKSSWMHKENFRMDTTPFLRGWS